MKRNGGLTTLVSPERAASSCPDQSGEKACECGWRRTDNSTSPVFYTAPITRQSPATHHPLPPPVARTHGGARVETGKERESARGGRRDSRVVRRRVPETLAFWRNARSKSPFRAATAGHRDAEVGLGKIETQQYG